MRKDSCSRNYHFLRRALCAGICSHFLVGVLLLASVSLTALAQTDTPTTTAAPNVQTDTPTTTTAPNVQSDTPTTTAVPNVTTFSPNHTYALLPDVTEAPAPFVLNAWVIAVLVLFGFIVFGLGVWAAYRQKQGRNREKEEKMRAQADMNFRQRLSEMERRVEKL